MKMWEKIFRFNPICSKLTHTVILQQKKLVYVYLFLFDGAHKILHFMIDAWWREEGGGVGELTQNWYTVILYRMAGYCLFN